MSVAPVPQSGSGVADHAPAPPVTAGRSEPARSAPMLTARGLVKSYGRARAVDSVDLDIPERAFTTLLGPSGCGKTTMLRLIAGFERPDSGTLELDGHSLARVPPERRPVNTVFQSYALFPHLTVSENVAFSLTLRRGGLDPSARVARALESVHMAEFGARYPHELSGGQQQRVAVARAIIAEPRLLLLDEPLSALDRKMRAHLQIELKDLQRRLGIAFVYVTHDQEEAFALSDIVVVMNGGKIAQRASPQDIYAKPANAFVADFIGGATLVPGTVISTTPTEAVLDTAIGVVQSACAPDLAPGAPAVLVIRPEHVSRAQVGDAPQGAALAAVVEHAVFQGDGFMMDAVFRDVRLRFHSQNPLQPGDTVSLHVDTARTFITRPA